MRMRGRDSTLQTYNSAYRFGFNGKEQDKSITSQDYDYGMRIYDARVGRFLSVDPITKKYPELTPYQFASNRPIDGIDLDGLEYATFFIEVDKNNKVTKITVTKDYELKQNGSQGPGILYYYKKTGEAPESKFVKNLYGIYVGSDNPQTPVVGKDYRVVEDNYDLAPIDETDANALQHDYDYNNIPPAGIRGIKGVMDEKSSKANEDFIKRAKITIDKYKKGENDDITGKPVTKAAADAAVKYGWGSWKSFRKAEDVKESIKILNNMKNVKIPAQ